MGQPFHKTGLEDLSKTLREGMEMGATPQRLREEAKQRMLTNALSQRKMEHPGLEMSDPILQAMALSL